MLHNVEVCKQVRCQPFGNQAIHLILFYNPYIRYYILYWWKLYFHASKHSQTYAKTKSLQIKKKDFSVNICTHHSLPSCHCRSFYAWVKRRPCLWCCNPNHRTLDSRCKTSGCHCPQCSSSYTTVKCYKQYNMSFNKLL